MLCRSLGCGCAFQSASLEISGSGGPGDPLSIEVLGPGIVDTSADVTSPFLGQFIYETVTGRFKSYDGSNWVIVGGKMPQVSLTRSTTLAAADASSTNLTFPTEVYDTDGFHAASSHTIVIPTGLGGKYHIDAQARFASSATGYRIINVAISSNASVTDEVALFIGSTNQAIATTNNAANASKDLRLEAGATLTFTVFQTSGGSLNVTSAFATLRMVEHEPALT